MISAHLPPIIPTYTVILLTYVFQGIRIFLVFHKCLCCTNFANKVPKCSSVIHINILQLSLCTFFEVPLAGNKCITKNPPQSLLICPSLIHTDHAWIEFVIWVTNKICKSFVEQSEENFYHFHSLLFTFHRC